MLAALIVQAAVIAALITMSVLSQRDTTRTREAERQEWFHERQVLLNRIKPETAQIVSVGAPEVTPAAISTFDDDEWFEVKQAELERLAS